MARIELWNGDICDLEVDAIVNAANLSLWMSTGVGGALKRAGGDAIEFAAVRQAPVPLGGAIVTPVVAVQRPDLVVVGEHQRRRRPPASEGPERRPHARRDPTANVRRESAARPAAHQRGNRHRYRTCL